MTLLLKEPPKVAAKPARKKAAPEPAEAELVYLDHHLGCACITLKGVPYFCKAETDEAETDEAETLIWHLYRKDGCGVKEIQVVDHAGVVDCDCESQNYSGAKDASFRCKHILGLRRFRMVSAETQHTQTRERLARVAYGEEPTHA